MLKRNLALVRSIALIPVVMLISTNRKIMMTRVEEKVVVRMTASRVLGARVRAHHQETIVYPIPSYFWT